MKTTDQIIFYDDQSSITKNGNEFSGEKRNIALFLKTCEKIISDTMVAQVLLLADLHWENTETS